MLSLVFVLGGILRHWLKLTVKTKQNLEIVNVKKAKCLKDDLEYTADPRRLTCLVCALINELRKDEGDWVRLLNDNASFQGESSMVSCFGAWTEFKEKFFVGDSVHQCLEKAVEAREKIEADNG